MTSDKPLISGSVSARDVVLLVKRYGDNPLVPALESNPPTDRARMLTKCAEGLRERLTSLFEKGSSADITIKIKGNSWLHVKESAKKTESLKLYAKSVLNENPEVIMVVMGNNYFLPSRRKNDELNAYEKCLADCVEQVCKFLSMGKNGDIGLRINLLEN